MGAEPLPPLNIIGWRGVGLSWLALGIVAPMIPAIAGVIDELEALDADEQAVPA